MFSILLLTFKNWYYYVCVFEHAGATAVYRGQFWGAGAFLLPCWVLGSNARVSGFRTSALPTELPHWPVSCFQNRASQSPGWPPTWGVAKDEPQLLVLCLYLLSAKVTACAHLAIESIWSKIWNMNVELFNKHLIPSIYTVQSPTMFYCLLILLPIYLMLLNIIIIICSA